MKTGNDSQLSQKDLRILEAYRKAFQKELDYSRKMDEQLQEAQRQFFKDREEMERKPRIQINIY
jgi:uncharacterized protein